MSNRGSLLGLDRYATEESIRVAVYGRALEFSKIMKRTPPVEEIAEAFIAFVGGEGWRLDVLDVALGNADRHHSIETLLELASEVAAWATPPEPPPAPVVANLTTETKPTKRAKSKKR